MTGDSPVSIFDLKCYAVQTRKLISDHTFSQFALFKCGTNFFLARFPQIRHCVF